MELRKSNSYLTRLGFGSVMGGQNYGGLMMQEEKGE